MKKRICLITSSLDGGGVGRNMVNLANAFSALGFEVTLFLMRNADNKRAVELSKGVKLEVGARAAKGSIIKLRKHLLSSKPQVVISGPSYINVLVIISLLFVRNRPVVILTYRSNRESEISNQSFWFCFFETITFPVYRLSDFVVGVSKGVTENLGQYLKGQESKLITIYNPAWTPIQEKQLEFQADHQWFSPIYRNTLRIVSIGRLEVQKDYFNLILAFERILKFREAKLIIIGEGSLRNDLQSFARQLGIAESIDFLGFVENPLSYLSQCDIFVLASKWEGFANVIVESLGAGVNVVSTACPSGPSEILDEGKYGRLVPVSDSEALANAVLSLDKERLPSAYLKKRALDFSAERAALAYAELFEGNSTLKVRK